MSNTIFVCLLTNTIIFTLLVRTGIVKLVTRKNTWISKLTICLSKILINSFIQCCSHMCPFPSFLFYPHIMLFQYQYQLFEIFRNFN